MNKLWLFLILFLAPIVGLGQSMSVTATLTDPDGSVWFNGSCSIQVYNETSVPFQYQGTIIPLAPACAISNTGVLNATMYNTNTLFPLGAQYQITACSNSSAPCTVFITPVTASNQTTLFSSFLKAPRFNAIYGSFGYLDAEVNNAANGSYYYNVTLSAFRQYNGSSWATIGSGGGGGLSSFTSSSLVPLFSTSLGSSPTTSPALTFSPFTAAQNVFLAGPTSGGTGAYSFRAIVVGDIPTLNQNTTGTASNLSGTPSLPNGTTATTQTTGDATTKLATDAFVGTAVSTAQALDLLKANNLSDVASNSTAATNVTTFIKTQTGCTTSGFVWVPASGTCVAQSGGSSGISGLTTGQVGIAGSATTLTSSKALAGSGAGITTGPSSGVTAADVAVFTGTGGQITDGALPAASIVTLTGTQSVTNKTVSASTVTATSMCFSTNCATGFQGTGTSVNLLTATGTFVSGDCVTINSTLNAVDAGAPCGSGGGGGGTTATLFGVSGTTSVACLSATCTNLRGEWQVVAGSSGPTGVVANMDWTATSTAYVCQVTQNGGATNYGLGNTIATTTSMSITADNSVTGATFNFSYICTP